MDRYDFCSVPLISTACLSDCTFQNPILNEITSDGKGRLRGESCPWVCSKSNLVNTLPIRLKSAPLSLYIFSTLEAVFPVMVACTLLQQTPSACGNPLLPKNLMRTYQFLVFILVISWLNFSVPKSTNDAFSIFMHVHLHMFYTGHH